MHVVDFQQLSNASGVDCLALSLHIDGGYQISGVKWHELFDYSNLHSS